jgi:hypothetical protein
MDTSRPTLLKFEIIGLHGVRNITAEFTDSIKILVDENGTGKTTVLYLLVNLLNGNLARLSKYSFKTIGLTFQSSSVVISSEELKASFDNSSRLGQLLARYPATMIAELVEDAMRMPFQMWHRNHLDFIEHISLELEIPPRHLFSIFEEDGQSIRNEIVHNEIRHNKRDLRSKNSSSELNKKLELIKDSFPYQILYFPTYRLVEENSFNIGVDNKRIKRIENSEVQFGMDIVSRRLTQITNQIRKSSVEWYSKISGQMLGQLIGGLRSESIDYENVCRADALRIVLDRIGPNVSENDKYTILSLVQSEKIREREYEALAYFLSNLITIYEQQQAKDESIKAFVKVANGYLSDKEIIYTLGSLILKMVCEICLSRFANFHGTILFADKKEALKILNINFCSISTTIIKNKLFVVNI